MSDSVKLRYERSLLFLVLFYISLTAGIVFIFLTCLINFGFLFLIMGSLFAFGCFVTDALVNFKSAIEISKKEETNKER